MARGLLMLRLHQLLRPSPRLMPTTAMGAMARGLLMPRPTMEATAMEPTEAMAATAMARGLLKPRPTMEATAMEDTEAMAVTAMARGLLMLRLHQLLRPSPRRMPTTAMAVMVLVMVVTDTARGLLMPTMEATAMEAMAATAMAATAMARGP